MIRFSTALLTTLITASVNVAIVNLYIIGTTDLHSNMIDFDYYKDTATEKFGLVCTVSPINDTRNEAKSGALVDDGDLIQGSPLADYTSAKGLKTGDVHPVYKALSTPDHAVGTLGNHEFNYGLDYLKNALVGVKFPYANTNVIDARTKQPMSTPHLIRDTEVVDKDGKKQALKVGYIGVVPPQIMDQGRASLSGKMTVNDIIETMRKYVPEMREKGTDVVVVLAHSGSSADLHKVVAENSAYYLSETPGVNAITLDHAHTVFPGKDFADIEGADIVKGMLDGVPAVMPGMWGDHSGVVDLQLSNDNGEWRVMQAKTEIRPTYDIANKKSLMMENSKLIETFKADHDATCQLVSKPIGKSVDNICNYLALVQNDPTVQAVNSTQEAYAGYYIQSGPDLTKLSVLSAAAPFRAGNRKNNPADHVKVEKGQLTFHNAADLYLYPNTLIAMKASDKEVREWLECSAGQFNQTDPNSTRPQSLINWDGFCTYSFDVIDDVNYQIDVTRPARYNGECQVINTNMERIKNLAFSGKPIDPNTILPATTNNYHAYGGKLAGTGGSHIAFASLDENRPVLTAWIADESKRVGEAHPATDNNWHLAPTAGDKKLDIRFETSPSDKVAAFIKEKGQYLVNKVTTDDAEFAIYQVDLSK